MQRDRLQRRRHHPRRRRQRHDHGPRRRRHHRRRQVARRADRRVRATTPTGLGTGTLDRAPQQHDDAGDADVQRARSIRASWRSSARSRPTRRPATSTSPSTRAAAANTPSPPRRRPGHRHAMRSRTRSTAPTAAQHRAVQFADGSALNIIVGTPGNDVLNGTAAGRPDPGPRRQRHAERRRGNDILVGGPNGAVGRRHVHRQLQQRRELHRQQRHADLHRRLGRNRRRNADTARPAATSTSTAATALPSDDDIDGGETIQRAVNLSGVHVSHASASTWRRRRSRRRRDRQRSGVQRHDLGQRSAHAWRRSDATTFSMALTAAQIGAHTAIRFVANGTISTAARTSSSTTSPITASAVETLNGGNGDDTYSFTPRRRQRRHQRSWRTAGAADRISILSTTDRSGVRPAGAHRRSTRATTTPARERQPGDHL